MVNRSRFRIREFFIGIILFSLTGITSIKAQTLDKEELPISWLGDYKHGNNPDQFLFKNDKLKLKTDPYLHFGFQYTTIYQLEWLNDSTFNLEVKKNIVKNNNPLHKKFRRRVESANSFFYLDDYENFKLIRKDEHYILEGKAKSKNAKLPILSLWLIKKEKT